MVRGLGGHFCFDFFLLRFFDISSAVLTTTDAELSEGTTGRGGGGGGGGIGADCSIFCCNGIGGGGGGGDGATTAEAAGDATELSDPGLDATVAGLEEAAVVRFETLLPPTAPLLLGHPSSDPSWLGDSAPNRKKKRIRHILCVQFAKNGIFQEKIPSELLSSPSGVTYRMGCRGRTADPSQVARKAICPSE